ncbi:M1 family metallopeptidase [soil metagenome]
MCTKHANNEADTAVPSYKLPTSVTPSHYRVRQMPDFGSFTFTGDVEIDIDVHRPVTSVTLNAKDLKCHSAYVVHENGTRLDAIMTRATVKFADAETSKHADIEHDSAGTYDAEAERLTFNFNGTLGSGKWKFFAEYEGSLVQPSLEGFYRAKWTDDQGVVHWIGTTQFEATHARRAFPCFDEPALKATFDIELVVDDTLTALSNGRIKSEEPFDDGKRYITGGPTYKLVKYHTTPKQSTYLVAYCIGEFESSEPVFANNKEIRIWSIPGQNHLKSLALRTAAFGVKWFEEFFDRPYFGGDKIDMIAIPDFRSGAMENTGLITYRATALLVDETKATSQERKRVAEVVLHELDHQWNGNEVTMSWWDGLGLNESFATIMAYISMNDFNPEWEIFNDFGSKRAGAFALDSLKRTHPVFGKVGHPDEVEQIFDMITYEKGGSLLFQIIQYIGKDVFRDGMRIYMERHALGNTEVTDLWDALEEGCKLHKNNTPVRHIMDTWMLTSGHPILTVSESDKPGFVTFSQEQFQFLPEGESTQLWPIPVHIRYATAGGEIKEEKFLVSDKTQTVYIDKDFKYIVANAGGSGFYRVRYSDGLLARLTENPLATMKVIERFNLVNDSWAGVRADKISSETYLGLVSNFGAETNPNVWAIISGSLGHLYTLTTGAERQAMKALIGALVKPVFTGLGWTPAADESSATRELRGSLAGLLGTVGSDADVRAKANDLYTSWKKDPTSIDPNVVPAVVSIMAHTGDKARYDEFVGFAKSSKTDQEKLRFLTALGKFREPTLYTAAMQMMLAEVKTDDAPHILAVFLGTEHAGEATWNFLRENWVKINEKFPTRGVVRMVESCSGLDTPELQAEILDFFEKNEVKQGDVALGQMLERLAVNVRLRQNETPKLSAKLVPIVTADGAEKEPAPVK